MRCPLDAALKNSTTQMESKDSREVIKALLAKHTFQEFNDIYGIKSEGHYLVAGGQGEYNQGNYKKLQDALQQSLSIDKRDAAYSYYATSAVDPDAYKVWLACKVVTNGGFFCSVEPRTENNPHVIVTWSEIGSDAVTVSSSYLNGGEATGNEAPRGQLLPRNKQILGDEGVWVKRNPTQALDILVNVSIRRAAGRVSKHCSIYLPRTDISGLADISADFVGANIGPNPHNEALMQFKSQQVSGDMRFGMNYFEVPLSGKYKITATASCEETPPIGSSKHATRMYTTLSLLKMEPMNGKWKQLTVSPIAPPDASLYERPKSIPLNAPNELEATISLDSLARVGVRFGNASDLPMKAWGKFQIERIPD